MGRGLGHLTLERLHAAMEILSAIQPATVRAVCYQLFIRKLIVSMDKNETNKISRLLVGARERGDVPWSSIVDEVREPRRISAWSDLGSYLRATKRDYRRDRWRDQTRRVQVWSEKGTVEGTLQPVLETYGVTFFPIGGYGSATNLHNAAAESLDADDRPLTVLYCGDYDCSGMHMSAIDIPRRIARYGGRVEFIRLAITDADTADPDLPWFPARDKGPRSGTKGDPRYPWFVERYGARCWELDALNPAVLRDRVEQAIRLRIDFDAWERAEVTEQAEMESLSAIVGAWSGISGQASKYEGRP